MKKVVVAALLAALVALSMHVSVRADITSGKNFNVNPGVVDQLVGDVFLQRQVEPKGAVSGINPRHILALANDYRTVDFAADTGVGEGTLAATIARWFGLSPQAPIAAPPDAWMGVYRSYDGGEKFWNGLWPGFPTDTTPLGMSQPHFGLAAASDAGVVADGSGRFYVVAMFFDRGGRSVIVADRMTDFNDESKHPIRWDNIPRVLTQGSANASGRFADLPSLIWDVYRGAPPASNCGHVYVGYTLFQSNNNSSIYFSVSNDCGLSYSAPRRISGSLKKNQRVVMAVDKRPTNQGGGALYAASLALSGVVSPRSPRTSDAIEPTALSTSPLPRAEAEAVPSTFPFAGSTALTDTP